MGGAIGAMGDCGSHGGLWEPWGHCVNNGVLWELEGAVRAMGTVGGMGGLWESGVGGTGNPELERHSPTWVQGAPGFAPGWGPQNKHPTSQGVSHISPRVCTAVMKCGLGHFRVVAPLTLGQKREGLLAPTADPQSCLGATLGPPLSHGDGGSTGICPVPTVYSVPPPPDSHPRVQAGWAPSPHLCEGPHSPPWCSASTWGPARLSSLPQHPSRWIHDSMDSPSKARGNVALPTLPPPISWGSFCSPLQDIRLWQIGPRPCSVPQALHGLSVAPLDLTSSVLPLCGAPTCPESPLTLHTPTAQLTLPFHCRSPWSLAEVAGLLVLTACRCALQGPESRTVTLLSPVIDSPGLTRLSRRVSSLPSSTGRQGQSWFWSRPA